MRVQVMANRRWPLSIPTVEAMDRLECLRALIMLSIGTIRWVMVLSRTPMSAIMAPFTGLPHVLFPTEHWSVSIVPSRGRITASRIPDNCMVILGPSAIAAERSAIVTSYTLSFITPIRLRPITHQRPQAVQEATIWATREAVVFLPAVFVTTRFPTNHPRVCVRPLMSMF